MLDDVFAAIATADLSAIAALSAFIRPRSGPAPTHQRTGLGSQDH
jgi:hypothetical protein